MEPLQTFSVQNEIDVLGNDKEPHFGYGKVFAPWATKRYPLGIDGLHDEILDVYNWLRPTHIETKLRYQVFEKVRKVIFDRWASSLPNLRISVFGSLRTRLFLPTSDIDVLVEYDRQHPDDPNNDIMDDTAETLKELCVNTDDQKKLFRSISVLTSTPVPIIKVVDDDTSINIDISFNTVQGVRAANYIEVAKNEFPVMEPLVLILKQFLSQRRLNLTYTGGLSSYGLILMLQHFLQTNYAHMRGRNLGDADVNLGVLLMRFFEVYALEFHYADLSIHVKDKVFARKLIEQGAGAPNLSIEDPLLAGNDVGRSTFNMVQVRCAFEKALISLRGVFVKDRPGCAIWRQRYPGSIMGHLLQFSANEIGYRNWLKGYTLKRRDLDDALAAPLPLVEGMLLAPAVDRSLIQSALAPVRKPLPIVAPEDVAETSEKSVQEERKQTPKKEESEVNVESAREAEHAENNAKEDKDSDADPADPTSSNLRENRGSTTGYEGGGEEDSETNSSEWKVCGKNGKSVRENTNKRDSAERRKLGRQSHESARNRKRGE